MKVSEQITLIQWSVIAIFMEELWGICCTVCCCFTLSILCIYIVIHGFVFLCDLCVCELCVSVSTSISWSFTLTHLLLFVVLLSYFGFVLFVYFIILIQFFSNERTKWYGFWRKCGKDLKELREETIIRIYYILKRCIINNNSRKKQE